MNVILRNRSVPATPPVTPRRSCLCVPTCPLDQGKPRCERAVAGTVAGYCLLAFAALTVVAWFAAVVVKACAL